MEDRASKSFRHDLSDVIWTADTARAYSFGIRADQIVHERRQMVASPASYCHTRASLLSSEVIMRKEMASIFGFSAALALLKSPEIYLAYSPSLFWRD